MPNYTVPIPGGGEYHVNASSYSEALNNVGMGGGGGGGGGATASSGGGGGGGGGTGANWQAAQMALSNAQQAANQAYLNAKLNLETEQQAFDHAQQAFTNEITKAGLTGMYQGAPTQAALQYGANTFGTWGMPQAGAETLASQLQTANQLGTYQGQQTLGAQQQYFNQWLAGQQQALAQQKQQQDTANQYLTLLSQMRGPQNYFQYQNVLGSTPGGMRDLVAAAMGQYVPGGGATTGMQPTAQSLQGMRQDVLGAGGGTNMMGAQQSQPGQPAMGTLPQMTGYQPWMAGAAGGQMTPQMAGGGSYNPSNDMLTGAGQYQQQPTQANQMNLPAPNQISSQAWKNLAPSQQQLLQSAYEAQGWNKDDVNALLSQSLPKYASNAPSAGTWRLGNTPSW